MIRAVSKKIPRIVNYGEHNKHCITNKTIKPLEATLNNLKNEKTILAHRGNWHKKYIENTLASFEETLQNVDETLHGFECDLKEIKDNNQKSQWVVFHDETMDRFNGSKTNININEILKIDGRIGKIPSLEELCLWISTINKPILINIEIKNGSANSVINLIEKLNAANINNKVRFIFSTFEYEIIQILKNETNEKIGYLINNKDDLKKINHIEKEMFEFVTIDFNELDEALIHQLNDLGIKVGVYFSTLADFNKNFDMVKENSTIHYIFSEE